MLGDCLEARLEHGLKTGVSLGSLLCAGHGGTGHADNHDIVVTLGADGTTVVGGLLGKMPVGLSNSLHCFYKFKIIKMYG